MPGEQREEAELHDPARGGVGEDLRDAGRGQQQRDRQRQQPHARFDRRQPERDRQEQRHREEQPAPAAGTGRRTRSARRAASRLRRIAGSISGSCAAREPPVLPCEEQPYHDARRRASARSPATGRATRAPRAWAGRTPRRPRAGSRTRSAPARAPTAPCPTRSRRTPVSGGESAIRRVSARIASTISTSPTNTQRHER